HRRSAASPSTMDSGSTVKLRMLASEPLSPPSSVSPQAVPKREHQERECDPATTYRGRHLRHNPSERLSEHREARHQKLSRRLRGPQGASIKTPKHDVVKEDALYGASEAPSEPFSAENSPMVTRWPVIFAIAST